MQYLHAMQAYKSHERFVNRYRAEWDDYVDNLGKKTTRTPYLIVIVNIA